MAHTMTPPEPGNRGRPLCRGTRKDGNPCQQRAAKGSAYCAQHGGAKRKTGRPSKINGELVDAVLELVAHGSTFHAAAQAAGVDRTTLHAWRERGEADLDAGKDTVYARLAHGLPRARARGEASLVDTIRAHATLDWRAAAWLLERRNPEDWAKRDSLDVNVNERAKPRDIAPTDTNRDRILDVLNRALQPPAGTGADQ